MTPGTYEARLAAMRVLVGGFCLVYLSVQFRVYGLFLDMSPERFEPVGLCQVLDQPLPASLATLLCALCIVVSGLFSLGYRFTVVGPLFAALLMWVASYRSSFGMMFHSDNLLCLHVLLLGLSPAAKVFSVEHRGTNNRSDPTTARIALFSIAAVTAGTYVVAGVAKLKLSGLDWMQGDILRNYIAYDCLRKIQLGSIHSPLGVALVQYGAAFMPLGVLTMVIELGAPLALLSPRVAKFWSIAVLAFHYGVLAFMAIAFVYPLSGIPYLALLPAEKLFRFGPVKRIFSTQI